MTEDKLEKIDTFFKTVSVDTKSFNIKYNDTPQNRLVHETFQKFCKEETDNGYLMGLKKLLEIAGTDWKYDSLKMVIDVLTQRIDTLEKIVSIRPETNENKHLKNTFGGLKDGDNNE